MNTLGAKPGIAIISNVQTPYRLHAHLRLARELTEVTLWSLYTHGLPDQPWQLADEAETNPVHFGRGEDVTRAADPRRAWREWRRGGRIIAWLKEHRIAAVVITGYNDAGRLRIIRWCRAAGVPLLMHADSNARAVPTGFKRFVKPAIVRWIVRRCGAFLPFGSAGAEYFRQYGAPKQGIFFFPAEPDYDRILKLAPEAIDAAASKHGLRPGRRRFVFCARMLARKRPDLALRAFEAIAEERPEWDLVMIGDGPLAGELKAAVPERLRERITFTGFIGVQDEISAIYRRSDVLVFPSDYEPWGLVVNEAATAGMAIVASDVVGSVPELVKEGVNGRAFRAGSLDALKAAMLGVSSPESIDRLKEASPGIAAAWRREGDPVQGLRLALRYVGVIP